MKRVRWLLASLGIIAAVTTIQGPLAAQVSRADSAAVLMAIARDLIVEGSEDRALTLLAVVVERYGDTAPARDAAEQLARLRASARESGGETELIAWSTVYGAAVGLLIPAALGAEEGAPYGAGLLIGTPIGFFASRSYANTHRMTPGHARAITFGTWWGALQGVGWQEVFDIGDSEDLVCPSPDECFMIENDSERAPLAAALIGSVAGMGVGALLGQTRPISASTALISNFGALWGSWYGLAGAVIAGAEDDGLLSSTLIGGNLGLLLGALGGPHMQMTTSRAWLVHLSGIAGLAVGGGIDLLVEPEDAELGVLIPAVTSGIGLAIGFATTSPETAGVDMGGNGSFASYADGRWSFGVPLPVPTVQRPIPGRATLALRLDLFRAGW